MTNEEKRLLFKVLCEMLPYGVVVHFHDINVDDYDRQLIGEDLDYIELDGRNYKPYLRPMSSMTDEEKGEYSLCISMTKVRNGDALTLSSLVLIDWLNAHHFDYRYLIEKGLALEAPVGIYKSE